MEHKDLKIAICEDDAAFAQNLTKFIKKIDFDLKISVFSSGEALLTDGSAVHIYLLDLDLPGMNGIETAAALRKKENDTDRQSEIIFITGYDNKMSQAFDVQAYHYLLKPLDETKFKQVFENASARQMNKLRQSGESVTVKAGGRHNRIFLKDIKYADCYQKKITLHTVKEDVAFYKNMEDFENCLNNNFFRCHRGVIVNLSYVEKFDSQSVTLTDGTTLNMSRRKFADFENAFLAFVKKEMCL